MTLNHQDIQAILQTLDKAPYDEFTLETSDYNLYLKRTSDGEWTQNYHVNSTIDEIHTDSLKEAEVTPTEGQKNEQRIEPDASEEGLIDLRSPMVGTFYRSPQPGEPSFVQSGDLVEENTIIAIIEVMKLMSSIPSLIKGEVKEILVEDAQLVEKGQLLMRVKPTA